MSEPVLVSVVVPVYNEESNIQPFYTALTTAIATSNTDFEIIFVDDGSSDKTFPLIRELSQQDCRVKALRFSRNFGSHAAMSAGLRYASGDAAVIISVDLQDPPELINTFVEQWHQGYHVVWGVRESRDDPWTKKTLASLFYALLRRIALPDYPPQGMDCGLLDRQVLAAFNNFHEINRIVPTTLVWTGFQQTQILYHRNARYSGRSKWSLAKRIKAAIDIIVSFSYVPIRLMSYLGIVVSFLSFVYAVFLIVRRVLFGLGGAGWPSVMVAVLFLGGVQLIMLGVLGEYIWRASEQVRGRPMYIVMEQIGFNVTKQGRDSI
jgi:dolichol-phosphate mannosyltransferase